MKTLRNLKALSIKQPWIWAILRAGKDIENRDWPTKWRGTIALHASKSLTKTDHLLGSMMIEEISGLRPPNFPMVKDRGFILGLIDIVDCVTYSNSNWFQGEYGFVLQNPRLLRKPIFFKGSLGFWDVPKEIVTEIQNQFDF